MYIFMFLNPFESWSLKEEDRALSEKKKALGQKYKRLYKNSDTLESQNYKIFIYHKTIVRVVYRQDIKPNDRMK